MAPVYTLSELCTINLHDISGFTRDCQSPGNVPVIGSGKSPKGTHAIANVPKDTILISRTGCHGQVSKYDVPVYVTNETYFLSDISPIVSKEFLYFFLREIAVDRLKRKNYKDNKALSILKLSKQRIYVPSKLEQQDFVTAFEIYDREGNTSAFDEKTLNTVSNMQTIISMPDRIRRRNYNRLIMKRFVALVLMIFVLILILQPSFDEKKVLQQLSLHAHNISFNLQSTLRKLTEKYSNFLYFL